jgi:hypothetical protein
MGWNRELGFDHLTWTEAEDVHLAFVPVPGVQVIEARLTSAVEELA